MSGTNKFFDGKENNDSSIAEPQSATVIPVIEEGMTVSKKIVESGKVTVTKKASEIAETLDVNLLSEEYEIEHIPMNEFVDNAAPSVRYEGDTIIIPVVKEVLVKRLLLTEEVRITKKTVQRTEQHHALLRKESVIVTHTPAGNHQSL